MNGDKPPLLAKKGRKWIYAFPLNPNEKINPNIKREEAKEKKKQK